MKSKCYLIPCAVKNEQSRIIPVELLDKLHEYDKPKNEMAGFEQTTDPQIFEPEGTQMIGAAG